MTRSARSRVEAVREDGTATTLEVSLGVLAGLNVYESPHFAASATRSATVSTIRWSRSTSTRWSNVRSVVA
jgi:hypothetical protein